MNVIERFNRDYLEKYGIPLDEFTLDFVGGPDDPDYAEVSCCGMRFEIIDGIVTVVDIHGLLTWEGGEPVRATPKIFEAIVLQITTKRRIEQMAAKISEIEKELSTLRAENAELRLLPEAPEYLVAKAHFEKLAN